jgi:4-hydroxy-3-methylbut-2-enyl diphosphate reductase
MSADEPGAGAGRRRLLLLAPLAIERAAVRGAASGAVVLHTGMGATRSRKAVSRAKATTAVAVAVVGFCGATDDSLRPGDVVVASEVRGPRAETVKCSHGPIVAALRSRGITSLHVGPIASVDHVVHGAQRAELARSGAVAVDMESVWLAEAAAGRPFAVVRVVVDTPSQELHRPLGILKGGVDAWQTLRQVAPALVAWAAASDERTILLASPRSFCAGARRAIEIVERALNCWGLPVYVRKQIVHNVHVISDLEARGAIFVDDLEQIPEGSLCVFSAHGVSPQVREQAAARHLKVIDATCPLVTKVHVKTRHLAAADYKIVLIGHRGHDEIEGTIGEAPEAVRLIESAAEIDRLDLGPEDHVAYLTQTTLAVDEVNEVVTKLHQRFPNLDGPDAHDICYATSNRQEAVKVLARESDLMIVIGSSNSSNSRRLVEVAEREGCKARLIDDENGLDPDFLIGVHTVAVTAGASAPDELVDRVVDALANLGSVVVHERRVVDETLQFSLPRELNSDMPEAEEQGESMPTVVM